MTNAQTEPTPEHTGPWRVVLVDDHGIFRAGVRHELEQASDKVEIVGEGEDVATSVKAILATVPDVVLLDVHLPGGGGAEVIKKVHATQPGAGGRQDQHTNNDERKALHGFFSSKLFYHFVTTFLYKWRGYSTIRQVIFATLIRGNALL